jgi:two-component system cell cycle response regulator DivK
LFDRRGLKIEVFHYNDFPFVNLYPLLTSAAELSWARIVLCPSRVFPMQKCILIVEDNELNMKLFNDLLEAHGYRTVQTRSGVEALDLARLHKPDLILMDIQLPEVSGLQVTQRIKGDENLRHIPVIAITAFAMKGDEEKIRQGGCEAYLSKPISIAKFLETVRNYLHEQ